MSGYDNSFTGVYGTLTVFIHRAKDLINVRRLDKQSPFIILRIQHMTARSKVCFRGGQTPSWNFLAKFEITPEIKPNMTIEVFHETNDAPKFIGKAPVDFTSAIFSDENDGDDRWIDLYNGVEYAGRVFVELSFKIKSAADVKSKSRTLLDDIDQFDQSVTSRELPPLPHESGYHEDYNNEQYSKSGGLFQNGSNEFGYAHGVPGGFGYDHGGTGAEKSPSRARINFGSQKSDSNEKLTNSDLFYSDSEYEAPNFSNSNDSKTSKVPDSEPLFAKLKELKGKMFSFKNQAVSDTESDMTKSNGSNKHNKVDFQELEKAVGVPSGDETYIEHEDNISEVEDLEPRFKLFNLANSRRVTSRVTENNGRNFEEQSHHQYQRANDRGQRIDSVSNTSSRRSSYFQSPTRNFTVYSNDTSPQRNNRSPSRRPPPPSS